MSIYQNNNYYNRNDLYQNQIQDTLKLEEQAFSNEILCRMLSAAECYFNRIMGKKNAKEIFSYYNGLNSGNTKNLEQLKKQFLHQIELFKNSIEDYYYNYQTYNFPNNLPKEIIENYIYYWITEIEKNPTFKKESNYYKGILNIINLDYKKISYRNEIKEMNKGKVNKEGKVAHIFMKNLPYIQEKAENLSRKVRENAKKGIYDINVVLNGNFKDDKELIDGYEKYKNLDNYINNTYDNEKNNEKYNIQGNNNYQNNNIQYENNYMQKNINNGIYNYNNNPNDINYNRNNNKNNIKNNLNNNVNEKNILYQKIKDYIETMQQLMDFYMSLYISNYRPKFIEEIPQNINKNKIIQDLKTSMKHFDNYCSKYFENYGKDNELLEKISSFKSIVINNRIGRNNTVDPIMADLFEILHKHLNNNK